MRYQCFRELNKSEEGELWSVSQLSYGDVPWDVGAVSAVFDRWYAKWDIINEQCDFKADLQMYLDLNRMNLIRYYNQLQAYTPYSVTDMDVTYGERGSGEKSYEYPMTASDGNEYPVRGTKSSVDEANDRTIVTRKENQAKELRNTLDITEFAQYFIACFKDCFTLALGVTW